MRSGLLLISFFSLLLSTQAQTFYTVESGNFFYTPASLTINVGDTVQWINVDGFHNVNALNNTITGVSFNNPESFISDPTNGEILLTRVFTVAGTYEYDCSVGMHAANGMVGTLIVEPSTSTSEIQEESIKSLNAFYTAESNTIQVQFNLKNRSTNTSLYLFNTAGQYIKTETISVVNGDNTHLIDLDSNIPSGIYFVSLHVDGASVTEKILIQ